MTILQGIMRFVTAVLSVYMLLIMFRILLTWFQGPSLGRAVEILHSITEPYLGWFRRFTIFRIGPLDFSPIVAIIVLSVLTSVTSRLAIAATVTIGLILALLVQRVASAVGFFLVLFLVMAVIRAVGSMTRANTAGRFWITLDQLLEPVVHKTISYFAKGRFVSYRNALLMFAGMLAVTLFVGGFLIDLLASGLIRLPF